MDSGDDVGQYLTCEKAIKIPNAESGNRPTTDAGWGHPAYSLPVITKDALAGSTVI